MEQRYGEVSICTDGAYYSKMPEESATDAESTPGTCIDLGRNTVDDYVSQVPTVWAWWVFTPIAREDSHVFWVNADKYCTMWVASWRISKHDMYGV